jgi:2-haloacid dehalogenase
MNEVNMSLDRRDFIGLLAAGTAATALTAKTLSAEPLVGSGTERSIERNPERNPEVNPEHNQGESGSESLPPIKAMVFDAYGTLFDVYSVATLGEQLFPSKGKELSQLWRTKQIDYTWLRSLMSKYVDFSKVTQDGLDFACKQLNLECTPAQRDKLMEAYNHLTAFPDVRPALEGLAPLPLAILSNGSPAMLQAAVKSSGIESLLKHVISVDEAGIFKPSPKVYQLAVDKFKLQDRRNIGFVSSNCWDAIGAKSFGFTTFWVNRSGAPVDVLGAKPDRILSKLTELIAVVKG